MNTVGKPVIIPGLPELASLVGNMAAQWEAHAQQAMQMETEGEAKEEAAAADDAIAGVADSVQAEAPVNDVNSANEAAQPTATKTDVVGISRAVEADEGAAVDVNADAAMPDMIGDRKASQRVAGVTSASDEAVTADAVEAQRQKKQKAAAKDY